MSTSSIPFPEFLLAVLAGASMSRANMLVIPGGKLGLAMELIVIPFIKRLIRGERTRDQPIKEVARSVVRLNN
jgi:phosphoribulokinase